MQRIVFDEMGFIPIILDMPTLVQSWIAAFLNHAIDFDYIISMLQDSLMQFPWKFPLFKSNFMKPLEIRNDSILSMDITLILDKDFSFLGSITSI